MRTDDLYALLPDDYLPFPGCHEDASLYMTPGPEDRMACEPFNPWDADGIEFGENAESEPGRREEEELPA